MKKILLFLLLLAATAYGQYPVNQKFKVEGDNLINLTGDGLVVINKTTGDTLMVLSDSEFMLALVGDDTVLYVTSSLFKITDSLSAGKINSDGQITGTNMIATGYVSCDGNLLTGGSMRADGDITANYDGEGDAYMRFTSSPFTYILYDSSSARYVFTHAIEVPNIYGTGTTLDIVLSGTTEGRINSSGFIAEDGSFYKDVVSADSGMATKHYSDHYFVDDSIAVGTIASRGDNWVASWDSANVRWNIEAQQGDTGITIYGIMADTSADSNLVDITGSNTYAPWVDSTQFHDENGMTYIDTSAGDRFVIDSTGEYQITFVASIIGTNAATITTAIFKNSTELPYLKINRKLGTGADVGAYALSGLASLTAGDTIFVKFKSDDGSDVGIHYASLSIHSLSGGASGGGGGSGTGWNWADSAGEPPFWVDSAIYADTSDRATSAINSDTSVYADTAWYIRGDSIVGANSIAKGVLPADATFLGGSIESADITNQTIVKADIDTTTSFTFAYPSYIEDGNEADSAIATKGYVDAQAATNIDTLMRNVGDTVTGTYDFSGGNIEDVDIIKTDTISPISAGSDLYFESDAATSDFIFSRDGTTYWTFGGGGILSPSNGAILFNLSEPGFDSEPATKSYHDTAGARYADSAGGVIDGAITLTDLGQNGAAAGEILKWNGSAWIPSSDATGSGYWGKVSGYDWYALVSATGDTLIQYKFTAGTTVDTIDVFTANGDILRFGVSGITYINDTISMGTDSLTDFTGLFLNNVSGALSVDTGSMSEMYVHETGDTMSGALHLPSVALYMGSIDSVYFDTVGATATTGSFKFSDDIQALFGADSTGGNVSGNANFTIRLNNTPNSQGNLYFGTTASNTAEWLRYSPTTDSFNLSGVLGLASLKTSTLTLSVGETVTFGSGTFSFSDDITATGGNVYSTNGSFYANSGAAAASGVYGLYAYDGAQTGAYLRFQGSNAHWESSDPIFIGDTTTGTIGLDSLLTTRRQVKLLIEDSLNNYIDSARVMDTIQANDNAVRLAIRDTVLAVVDTLTMQFTIGSPDLFTDTIPIYVADSVEAPNGITILDVAMSRPSAAADTLFLMSFTAADPPVFHDWIDTLITSATTRISSATFEDANANSIDVGQAIYILTSGQDIEWLKVKIRYYKD